MKYKDADIDSWPKSWAGVPDDVLYGKQVLPYMTEFIAALKQKNLSVTTVNSHIDELWMLGGKIVDAVHADKKNRDTEPLQLIFSLIDDEGGPLLDEEGEQPSFDRTCKKFYRFLRAKYES
jgi:hypothetical protein